MIVPVQRKRNLFFVWDEGTGKTYLAELKAPLTAFWTSLHALYTYIILSFDYSEVSCR